MSRTVISSKIASSILELQKSEIVWNEDILSIMKTSEITKILQKTDQNKSKRYDDVKIVLKYHILIP